jgi:hypothetical protein
MSDVEMKICDSELGRSKICGEAYAGTPQPLNLLRPAGVKKIIS